jgi:hypothetical protein
MILIFCVNVSGLMTTVIVAAGPSNEAKAWVEQVDESL